MFWKMTTGPHGISVDPSGVTVWVGDRNSPTGTTMSHLQFLDGTHQDRVRQEHGEPVLSRAISECHRYVEPTELEQLKSARLEKWRSISEDKTLEGIAAKPDATGSIGRTDGDWSVEFNPLERVVIDAYGSTWTAAERCTTKHPSRGSRVLVFGDWLYATGPGIHIIHKTGEPVLSACSIEPAIGINPWGFFHCVHAQRLFRSGPRVVVSYSLPASAADRDLRRLIGDNGLVELCPRRGIATRFTTDRFSDRSL